LRAVCSEPPKVAMSVSELPDGTVSSKIPIWVNFGGSYNGRCWYIVWPLGIFYSHLVYFVAIWYILWPFGIHILWPFGIFSPVLECCTKKHLATLVCVVKGWSALTSEHTSSSKHVINSFESQSVCTFFSALLFLSLPHTHTRQRILHVKEL
jgi:hypothetical protein